MPTDLTEQFGELVRKLRIEKGWSQEDLAEKADLHRNYVGFIERGERSISLDKAVQIAKALSNEPLEDLFRHLM